jgi:CSLREA domain-containing protein
MKFLLKSFNFIKYLLSVILLTFATSLYAATFTVTNTSDNDGVVCPDNTGQCSLRQAINAANVNSNGTAPDKIVFAIDLYSAYNDCRLVEGEYVCRISVIGSNGIQNSNGEVVHGLPVISDAVIIDGSIAENRSDVIGYPLISRPSIEIDGSDAGLPSTGLFFISNGSTVKGLILHSFTRSPINEFGGECIVMTFGAENNTVKANYIAADASGRAAISTDNQGIVIIDSPNNMIGGPNVDDRNIFLGAKAGATLILSLGFFGPPPSNNTMQNNFVGADVSGVGLGHPSFGFVADVAEILGAPFFGNITVKDNRFIKVSDPSDVSTIGFWHILGGMIKGNIISGSQTTDVIRVLGGSENISILQNAIFDNQGMGIDLAPILQDGVTLNDYLDLDIGTNNLQNFPELLFAQSWKGLVRIHGHIYTDPFKRYRLEFFANKPETVRITGYGPGQCFIGAYEVNTNIEGHSVIDTKNQFNIEFESGKCNVMVGDYITATATEMVPDGMGNYNAGSTSEFSHAMLVR